jgi:hypothetical protein
MEFDQYSRWTCPKCNGPGFDSWNKGIYDGIDWPDDDNPDNPHVMGLDCTECLWPAVIAYRAADEVPHVIFGPTDDGAEQYAYEWLAIEKLAAEPTAGTALVPHARRDFDWRGGCTNLREPPPLAFQ